MTKHGRKALYSDSVVISRIAGYRRSPAIWSKQRAGNQLCQVLVSPVEIIPDMARLILNKIFDQVTQKFR